MNKKTLKNRFGKIMSTILLAIILLSSINILIVNVDAISTVSNSNLIIADSQGLLSTDWEQINEDGFGNIENVGVRGIEIFDDNVLIGTASFSQDSGITIGKPIPIKDFYFEYFKNRSSTDNFKSNGCEIWSYNGTSVRPIVGNNSIMDRGFGNKNNAEIGFLIKFNNYLYAGTRNYEEGCEIWRTSNLDLEWECVAHSGFGNKKNSWAMEACVFKDHLYVGTYNIDEGTELYRTNDGFNWTQVIGKNSSTKNGFGNKCNFYTWSMCVYNGSLYVGTDYIGDGEYGGELWRSNNGVDWTPIISDADGALYHLDFKKTYGYHGGLRNMVLFKNELYIGFVTTDTPFTFGSKNFERLKLSIPGALPTLFSIFRMKRTLGLEIYKFNDTTNELTTVIGGVNRGVFSGGFGDDGNEYPWSMRVYNDSLYVGTSNVKSYDLVFERVGFLKWTACIKEPIGGGELWRYDGVNCEQINSDGFGDQYNQGIREMIVYNDKLIAGTMNAKTGCEIWKCDLMEVIQ
jgi:hypothetical protein